MIHFYSDLDNVSFQSLDRLFENLEQFPNLQGSFQAINDGGFLEHFASPELERIRRQLTNSERRVRQILQDMLKEKAELLSENLIASRSGRSVLPVKILIGIVFLVWFMTSLLQEVLFILSLVL